MPSGGLRRSFLVPAAALAALAVGVAAAALVHLRGFEQMLRHNMEREVASIADLEVAHLAEWRRQVVEDVGSLGELPAPRSAVLRLGAGLATPEDVRSLSRSLDARLRRQRLDAWLVVGPRGDPVLSDPGHPTVPFPPELARGAPARPGTALEAV